MNTRASRPARPVLRDEFRWQAGTPKKTRSRPRRRSQDQRCCLFPYHPVAPRSCGVTPIRLSNPMSKYKSTDSPKRPGELERLFCSPSAARTQATSRIIRLAVETPNVTHTHRSMGEKVSVGAVTVRGKTTTTTLEMGLCYNMGLYAQE
ncbi:hypothetical protein EYF80_023015 [Liparis tanakae]|uniref:Uncharacterized protein n=1 Tax=Liparis tanakae TaxID=230148 RepID=A0A4Z2HP61_9TELE|nr:hypothetical protein EYF80_023015 [Liparis tanakae]